jgi:hypothetical protein
MSEAESGVIISTVTSHSASLHAGYMLTLGIARGRSAGMGR